MNTVPNIDPQTSKPDQREVTFLNKLVVPLLSEHMQTVPGIGKAEALQSLVGDNRNSIIEYCSGNAARPLDHPFEKKFGEKPGDIMNRWKGEGKSQSMNGKPPKTLKAAWPDFAFRPPFPHKIIFEGKYFPGGNAENALVEAVYEACFYLGLPFVPAMREKPAWDYKFACLIAYDASENGRLKTAWDCVIPKAAFWENANVYVMVLGGNTIDLESKVAEGSLKSHESASKVAAADVSKQDIVTIYLPGAWENSNYIITPPLAGKERWFHKTKILSYVPHPDGGFVVTLAKRELATRGLRAVRNDPNGAWAVA